MHDAIFEARGLYAGYENEPVLKDAEIEVRKGEIVTLIGANGAGKSTLLKTMARNLPPIKGVMYLEGRDFSDIAMKDHVKRAASIFTARVRTDYMSCFDVAAMGRYPYTGRMGVLTDKDRDTIRTAMEDTGVWELRDRDFEKISDGQRQLVRLSAALCQEPELLILDEPVSFLDIRYRLRFFSILKNLAKEKRTGMLMSLHEIELAGEISDRIVCIKDGRVALQGRPEDVLDYHNICMIFGVDEDDPLALSSPYLQRFQKEI